MGNLTKYNSLSYYQGLLSNPNVSAFLGVIRKGESGDTLGGYSTFNGGLAGGFHITVGSPAPGTSGTNTTSPPQRAFGAYQFLPNTWNGLRCYQWGNALNLSDVSIPNQDVAALINIYNVGSEVLQFIIDGDIVSAVNALKGQWVSLPGGRVNWWGKYGGICGVLAYYQGQSGWNNLNPLILGTGSIKYNGSLADSNKQTYAGCPNLSLAQATGASSNTDPATVIALQKQLAINLAAIQNNVAVQEAGQTEATWGKRQTTQEQSDWIGLRQYLLYLATTFETESAVPFVELIPIFMMDNSTSGSQVPTSTTVDTNPKDVIANTQAQFKASIAKFNSLQNNANGTGGIDLVGIDPFQEMLNKSAAEKKITYTVTRNMGYKLYGTVVLSPGIEGSDQISKSGGIGFESFEIQQGAAVMQGMTTITIKILDVQGNKLLDPASPWSFILNASQIQGDFYFRYGWQINIPKYEKIFKSKTSTGSKFWNHPGWNIFGTANVSTDGSTEIEKLKQSIWSLAQKSSENGSSGVLTLTQAPGINSISYSGYKITTQNATGIGQFTVDRSQLNIGNYLIISMINPEISVNPTTGSITASIQFRMNTALGTLLCPLIKKANLNTVKLLNSAGGTTTLKALMIAFIQDNLAWVKTQANSGYKIPSAVGLEDMIKNPQTWLIVNDMNGKNIYNQVSTLPITYKDKDYGEINNPTTDMDGNNKTLRAWLFEVLSRNGITMVSAGDPGILTASSSAQFVLLYDNPNPNGSPITSLVNLDALEGSFSGTGFIGANTINRIVLQDDVFSFRFRGSLIEELTMETSNNPSAQQNQNIQALAASTSNPTSVTKYANENTASGVQKAIESVRTDMIVGPAQTVTVEDKNRNLGIILTRMSSCTIKCIAHPWLKIGMPIYVKGTGVFDSKYIIIKLTHNLEVNNKFTTTIVCVRVLNDVDYANSQTQLIEDQIFAQNHPGVSKSIAVSATSIQTIPVTNVNPTPSNAVTPLPQNTYLTPSINELPDWYLDSTGTYNPPNGVTD